MCNALLLKIANYVIAPFDRFWIFYEWQVFCFVSSERKVPSGIIAFLLYMHCARQLIGLDVICVFYVELGCT